MSRKTRRCRCPRCGVVFFTEKHDKTYCSEPCRKGAENARRYAKKRATCSATT